MNNENTQFYCDQLKHGATFYKVIKRTAQFVTVIRVEGRATKNGVMPTEQAMKGEKPLRRKIFNFSKSKDKAAEHIEIDMGASAYLWDGVATCGYLSI